MKTQAGFFCGKRCALLSFLPASVFPCLDIKKTPLPKRFLYTILVQGENRRIEKMLVKGCRLARTFALHIFERKLVLQVREGCAAWYSLGGGGFSRVERSLHVERSLGRPNHRVFSMHLPQQKSGIKTASVSVFLDESVRGRWACIAPQKKLELEHASAAVLCCAVLCNGAFLWAVSVPATP